MRSVSPSLPIVAQRASAVDLGALDALAGELAGPFLPGAADVESVAAVLRSRRQWTDSQNIETAAGWGTAEGRTFRITLSPGVVGARSLDTRAAALTAERVAAAAHARVDLLASDADADGNLPADPASFGANIAAWSGKSRANLTRTVGELDVSDTAWPAADGVFAMVTLTLPGEWESVAPNGKAFKVLLRKFRHRFTRATGLPWRCIWKLEFQRRGAPHWHALMRIPALVKGEPFEAWLSRTWANVVAADDTDCHRCCLLTDDVDPACGCLCEIPDTEYRRHLAAGTGVDYSGTKYSDPRRISIYFLGHSAKTTDGKEYQHVVPALWRPRPGPTCVACEHDSCEGIRRSGTNGPGRFWGYAGLDRARVEVDVTQREYDQLRRVLRGVARGRDARMTRLRAAQGLPPRVTRRRSLGHRGGVAGGWVLVNDALRVGINLARFLTPDPPLETREPAGLCASHGRLWGGVQCPCAVSGGFPFRHGCVF